jgi:hypothetical protein
MKIQRQDQDRLLLTASRRYGMLGIGLIGWTIGCFLLFSHNPHYGIVLFPSITWFCLSSGHGVMTFDRRTGSVTIRKYLVGFLQTRLVAFSNIRYAEAAQGNTNREFRLVLRGGRWIAFRSNAFLINNPEQAADYVNDFLGLYRPGFAPQPITAKDENNSIHIG